MEDGEYAGLMRAAAAATTAAWAVLALGYPPPPPIPADPDPELDRGSLCHGSGGPLHGVVAVGPDVPLGGVDLDRRGTAAGGGGGGSDYAVDARVGAPLVGSF